jgi:hypothetical protein
MTDVHDVVDKVESSAAFLAFNAENPHHYLVHAFSTAGAHIDPMELGYYGKEADKITVFKTDPLTRMPAEEVFKERGVLEALDLSLVKLGLTQALAKAEEYRHDAYPKHQTMKTICVLQQKQRPIWNMTIVTNTLNMINMRIDAQTGELISREMQSIMNLAKE